MAAAAASDAQTTHRQTEWQQQKQKQNPPKSMTPVSVGARTGRTFSLSTQASSISPSRSMVPLLSLSTRAPSNCLESKQESKQSLETAAAKKPPPPPPTQHCPSSLLPLSFYLHHSVPFPLFLLLLLLRGFSTGRQRFFGTENCRED